MDGWNQIKTWVIASRIHYVAAHVAIRALLILVMLVALSNHSVSRALLWMFIFMAVAVPLYGWFYYPRAKRKLTVKSR